LIKLFHKEGVGWGLLGLICGLYTLIWGWQNKDEQGIQNVMLIWTLLIVASIVLQVLIPAMR